MQQHLSKKLLKQQAYQFTKIHTLLIGEEGLKAFSPSSYFWNRACSIKFTTTKVIVIGLRDIFSACQKLLGAIFDKKEVRDAINGSYVSVPTLFCNREPLSIDQQTPPSFMGMSKKDSIGWQNWLRSF